MDLKFANEVLNSLWKNSHPFELEWDSDIDFFISSPDLNFAISYDGREKLFYVLELKVYPGIHTLSNGDPGYPDEYEYIPTGDSFDNFLSALRSVFKYEFEYRMDNLMECIGERENDSRIQSCVFRYDQD